MTELQEEYSFPCPSCGSSIAAIIELTAGASQCFTIDCEVCCRPIVIHATVDAEGVTSFDAEREAP
jgi:hypothetical protein